jgi:hypothetical protein
MGRPRILKMDFGFGGRTAVQIRKSSQTEFEALVGGKFGCTNMQVHIKWIPMLHASLYRAMELEAP